MPRTFGHLHDEWERLFLQDGLTCEEIARLAECNPSTVSRALRRRGIDRFTLTPVQQFNRRVSCGTPDECWVWNGHLNHDGYGRLWVDGRLEMAHRFSYRTAHGEIPDDMVVRHRCNNPPCVNPAHLLLGTQAENVADRQDAGTTARGRRMPHAKLTPDAVREIRRLRTHGVSYSELGRRFGVSYMTARHAALGINWGHID